MQNEITELQNQEGKTDSSEKITEGVVICPKCENCFNQKSKSTTIGFRKYTCPECDTKFIYPLRATTSFIYWCFGVAMLLLFIVSLFMGSVVIPGLLGIAIIYSLIKNSNLKEEIRLRQMRQKNKQEQPNNDMENPYV